MKKILENFQLVEEGTYTMGSKSEGTPHRIKVDDFYICKYQVTQVEYEKVTYSSNPSYFKGDNKRPVEQVSWFDAIKFCNLLNEKLGFPPTYDEKGNLLDASGKIATDITKVRNFRLPTEAEWEFAARGGNKSKEYEYSGSNNIKDVAWFANNSGKKTHPVGILKPNELGLYDMSGNVWEWCHDWYNPEYFDMCKAKGIVQNPVGPDKGSNRVLRGGAWYNDAIDCRVTLRNSFAPDSFYNRFGFRLVFVL